MTLVVADASAIAEYLFQTPSGLRIAPELTAPGQDIHIPSLCDVEIVATLRRALLQRRLNDDRAVEVLKDYEALPLSRHGHVGLLPRILALRANFSPYDATYVALAEHLRASLVTADRALARAVEKHVDLNVVVA